MVDGEGHDYEPQNSMSSQDSLPCGYIGPYFRLTRENWLIFWAPLSESPLWPSHSIPLLEREVRLGGHRVEVGVEVFKVNLTLVTTMF